MVQPTSVTDCVCSTFISLHVITSCIGERNVYRTTHSEESMAMMVMPRQVHHRRRGRGLHVHYRSRRRGVNDLGRCGIHDWCWGVGNWGAELLRRRGVVLGLLRRGIVRGRWRGVLWLRGRVVRSRWNWHAHLRGLQCRVLLKSERDLNESVLTLLAHDWDLQGITASDPGSCQRAVSTSDHVIMNHVLHRRRQGQSCYHVSSVN